MSSNTYVLQDDLSEMPAKSDAAKAEVAKLTFDVLTFRPMTVDDMLRLDDYVGGNAHSLHLIHLLTDHSKKALKRMTPRDFRGAAKALQDYVNESGNDDD